MRVIAFMGGLSLQVVEIAWNSHCILCFLWVSVWIFIGKFLFLERELIPGKHLRLVQSSGREKTQLGLLLLEVIFHL